MDVEPKSHRSVTGDMSAGDIPAEEQNDGRQNSSACRLHIIRHIPSALVQS
jgi:hypothetical protein